MQDEVLQEIKVLSERIYPGRSFEQLSPEEQEAVFSSFESQRSQGQAMYDGGQQMAANSGKTVGPYNVYVQNPWEALSGAVQMGMGGYLQGKANKQESTARKANADMITRRDARDRQYDDNKTREEEERRNAFLTRILGR